MSALRKARALQVIQRGADEQAVNRRHSSSPDEGIAELDGPTSVPILLELLKEKDERIQVLGDQLLRVSTKLDLLPARVTLFRKHSNPFSFS